MELLRGPTLHARLSRGPLSVSQGLGILAQIADALRTVHAHNLIHRDLKPSNVVIVDDHTVKVLDFGIAKDLSSGDRHKLTTTGTALGTLYYMAPEQIFGEKNLDPRCDVWALGVIVHECLTLRRPSDADGANSGQVLKRILEGEFPRLAALVPNCPRDLDELVARMLARKPTERPTSEEVFTALIEPMNAVTVAAGGLAKTNFMLETLPLSGAPQLARTVREERFAASQLMSASAVAPTMPATVVPSTVLAATAPPGTVVPATVLGPSPMAATVVPPTVASAAQAYAPAMTPARLRPEEISTFDVRVRPADARPRAAGVALALVATIAAIGIAVVVVLSMRSRHVEAAHDVPVASAPSVSSAVSAPAASAEASSTAPALAASVPKPPASAATHHAAAASSGRIAPPAKPPAGKDDPPITDQRF
jgi:hypothetical protein